MLLGVGVLLAAGCKQHLLTDYRPLDQAGMWSSDIEQLKGLNTSDPEVAQLVQLKQAGITDDTCIELVSTAHIHKHPFVSATSAANLAVAGFTEQEILELAHADQLDAFSVDAVTLKLTGLSEATVQTVIHRRLQALPVLSGPEIAKLKNTGLTEQQILQRINQGMTDEQAEKEIAARKRASNQTGFVRIHGRKPR